MSDPLRHPEKAHRPDSAPQPKKPDWIRVKAPTSAGYKETREIMRSLSLSTVCEEAGCPNIGECWSKKHATMMIMGEVCTRACTFCNVATGKPGALNPFEPTNVAQAVKSLGLSHVVITSVDRDDLSDGGAEIWAQTVRAIRQQSPGTTMETLIPDFAGKWENLQKVINVAPEVVSHNLETVRRLTKQVRIQAKYDRSLEVLMRLRKAGIRTKSGVMLGLGETVQEVRETMEDLRSVDCQVLTLGQYLQPTPKHLPVAEFVHPDTFDMLREEGLAMGFLFVESGPLVRSSYHAENHVV